MEIIFLYLLATYTQSTTVYDEKPVTLQEPIHLIAALNTRVFRLRFSNDLYKNDVKQHSWNMPLWSSLTVFVSQWLQN